MATLMLAIAATAVGAGWSGFIIAHRRRFKAKLALWDKQVAMTRLLIQLQPRPR